MYFCNFQVNGMSYPHQFQTIIQTKSGETTVYHNDGGRIQLDSNNALHFKPVRASDTGVYKCRAVDNDDAETVHKLIVQGMKSLFQSFSVDLFCSKILLLVSRFLCAVLLCVAL